MLEAAGCTKKINKNNLQNSAHSDLSYNLLPLPSYGIALDGTFIGIFFTYNCTNMCKLSKHHAFLEHESSCQSMFKHMINF